MRRRSERKKSTEVVSPPAVAKRPSRRSRRSPSQADTRKANKNEDTNINDEVISDESKQHTVDAATSNKDELDSRSSVSPQTQDRKSPVNDPDLETIQEEMPENSADTQKDTTDDTKSSPKEEKSECEQTADTTIDVKLNKVERTSSIKSQDESNNISHEKVSKKELQRSTNEDVTKQDTNDLEISNKEVTSNLKETAIDQGTNISTEKCELVAEHKKSFSRNRERRAQLAMKSKEEPENDENEEYNNKSQNNLSCFSTPSNEKTQNTRKRRWLSKRSSETNSQILAISTDSLKNLISDVHPVPLCDVKLESSSDVEEVESEREEGEASPTPYKQRTEKSSFLDRERKTSTKYEQPMRKISVMNDEYESAQPIPPRNASSCILYITNLVRPFTILQLKGLLARTGKIVENRFWIDKIKSKSYVQYETEDEAIETRHALHGVRWPISNPKCLNVDFGTMIDMEKAIASTQESGPQFGQETGRENRIVGTGWDRDRFEEKKVQVGRPVREWDVGKREELESEAERTREREKLRVGERGDRVIHNDRTDKDSARTKERGERERDRKQRRSSECDHRRTSSVSPARKLKKKNNDPPLRLLDDLFRKTKTTPCIYWLPLTPEQIAEKEAFRLRRIAEHQERVKQRELEKEKEREKERERERERDKDRRRERERSVGNRRSCSRNRRRY